MWLESMRPVSEKLLKPLGEIFRDAKRRPAERSLATAILADYAKDDPKTLGDLLLDADAEQFLELYPKFTVHQESLVLLDNELKKDISQLDENGKEQLGKRQANAAVALLRMNQAETVWPLLKHSRDPRVRSYIIHRCAPMHADASAIVARLDRERDVTIRRALILSLGEYADKTWSSAERQALVTKMRDTYQTTDDAGLRAAAEWLLRSWSENTWLKQVDQEWALDKDKREKRLDAIRNQLSRAAPGPEDAGAARLSWYVTGQAQTMVVIPGQVEFLMGSPTSEAYREDGPRGKTEMQQLRRLERSFAIAAKEVTMKQFRDFHKDAYQKDFLDGKEYSPNDDCPVNTVSWYQAVAYCNWLSGQEGIPRDQWCYERNDKDKYDEGMKLAADWRRRTGYRLPTEAEWEYACRAGALTSRFYGESEDLLEKYAWYSKNAKDQGMLPGQPRRFGKLGVTLKPNDFGLFDMLGNALEWCQDEYFDDVGNMVDRDIILNASQRMLRGGSFNFLHSSVRCAYRVWSRPLSFYPHVGFRTARTFP